MPTIAPGEDRIELLADGTPGPGSSLRARLVRRSAACGRPPDFPARGRPPGLPHRGNGRRRGIRTSRPPPESQDRTRPRHDYINDEAMVVRGDVPWQSGLGESYDACEGRAHDRRDGSRAT